VKTSDPPGKKNGEVGNGNDGDLEVDGKKVI
jgi:hypothetical protein